MDGLVHAETAGIERGRGQHADGAGQHGGGIGQDVAEHVAGHDDIELQRTPDELHGSVVDVHVRQFHIRIVAGDFRHDIAP